LWAGLRSLWYQGVVRAPRRAYFQLLWKGWHRDRTRRREASRAAARLERQLRHLTASRAILNNGDPATLLALLDRAHDALVRGAPERAIEEISSWSASLKVRIGAGAASVDDLRTVYQEAREFFVRQRRLHRFPGAYLVKAFNLAIKGLHYEIAMNGIVPRERSSS
jgi:hypothetical protein